MWELNLKARRASFYFQSGFRPKHLGDYPLDRYLNYITEKDGLGFKVYLFLRRVRLRNLVLRFRVKVLGRASDFGLGSAGTYGFRV